jgi:hypothetical protein
MSSCFPEKLYDETGTRLHFLFLFVQLPLIFCDRYSSTYIWRDLEEEMEMGSFSRTQVCINASEYLKLKIHFSNIVSS